MTVSDEDRKIGINISVPFKHIRTINEKAGKNRSDYIWKLIKKDLGISDE